MSLRLSFSGFLFLLTLGLTFLSCGQESRTPENPEESNYVSYLTGNTKDVEVIPEFGICMMGGRTEEDNAMRWFLTRANGGDILVLRTSGSDGYNEYLFAELGIALNSVETILFNGPSTDAYIMDKIDRAEGIWFAGGDQGQYLEYWKSNAVNRALQRAVDRGVVIGGTSAGMAILGEFIWDGESIQTDFLRIPFLNGIITDTHYDARNRMPRHLEFVATVKGRGIAADEYTAICIDATGLARIFGDNAEDDFAYFVDTDLSYERVKGTEFGVNSFDIVSWR